MPISAETLTATVVGDYLTEIADMPWVTLSQVRDDLLSRLSGRLALENIERRSHSCPAPALGIPAVLDEHTVVMVLLARRTIAAVSLAQGATGSEATLLATYSDSGPAAGLYVTDEAVLARLASEVRPSLTAKAIESLLLRLKMHAPVLARTTAPHLIAVNNGVFDHRSQELTPFGPQHVFLAKSPVDHVGGAPCPVITMADGTAWDVESWIESLSGDEGVPQLLWEVLSAAVRPGVRWNKAVFLHSTRGNNGKGTFCALLRNLLGREGCASIPIASFGKPFALSELVHARAIVTDENSVGAFARDLGDFKSVVTGDVFTLDRKYRSPVSVSFSGLVVQCVNDFPRSRDKSASYTRRQLFVPFRQWFGAAGVERGDIKSDYLGRREVLEYVLARVLSMRCEEFSDPGACQELLAQFQRENDPVRDFWCEFEDEFVWDLLPTAFLYDLFVSWFRKNHPSGIPVNRNEFATRLVDTLRGNARWVYEDPQKKHRPGSRMTTPEHLIARYDLKDWKNPHYSGPDLDKTCVPCPLRVSYLGATRVFAVTVLAGGGAGDATLPEETTPGER